MKNKARFKYNGGNLALLCHKCDKIIKEGKDFTWEESIACHGTRYLPPQYCGDCLNGMIRNDTEMNDIISKL